LNLGFEFTQGLAKTLVENNGKHLDYLRITNALMSEESLEIIINHMNLKAFELALTDGLNDWHALQRVAQKQTTLTYLSLIIWSVVIMSTQQI